MTFFAWDESYSVGVPQFDAHHRKIVDLIDRLHTGMKSGDLKETIKKTLDELVSYTVTHFTAEEAFMEEKKYPGLAAHCKEHADLVAKVRDLRSRFDKSDVYLLLTMEVFDFLKKWLQTHIRVSDRQYGLFVKRNP